jgi:hypothetical protein
MTVIRLFFSFFLVAAMATCHGVDRQQFRTLDGAGRSVAAGVEAKAGLAQYRQLVAVFSNELSKAREQAHTPADVALVEQYEGASAAMNDLLLVWEAREASGSDMLPIREALPARIAREYELGVNTNEPPSIYAGEAMQTIWAAAQKKLASAHAALVE